MAVITLAGRWAPGLAVALGALFFLYGFMLRVSPSVLVNELMSEFTVGGAALGSLSAVYFYAYGVLQIPVGVMMDRIGPHRLMFAAALIAAIGSMVFAIAPHLGLAYTGRVLIGIGCAFSWPGLLAIAHQWFPHRFAFVAGIGQLAGMTGAILGQAPFAMSVEQFGWRPSMMILAVFGAFLALMMWMVIRDKPHPDTAKLSIRQSLIIVARNKQVWLTAVFALSMAAPILSLGGLWGVTFITAAYDLPRTAAAGVVTLIFIGGAFCGPTVGLVSDWMGKRKPVMLICNGCTTLAMVLLVAIPQLPLWLLYTVVFMLGTGTASVVMAFAMGREQNAAAVAGISIGFVNTAVIGGGALFQPLIGWLLDLSWDGTLIDGVRIYAAENYRLALSILPVAGLLGFICIALTKETHCGRPGTMRSPRPPGSTLKGI